MRCGLPADTPHPDQDVNVCKSHYQILITPAGAAVEQNSLLVLHVAALTLACLAVVSVLTIHN